MVVTFEMKQLPSFCKTDAGLPMTLDIIGKGMDPIAFTISGMSKLKINVKCETAGQWIIIDNSTIPGMSAPTMGDELNFSLVATDGAIFQYTASGFEGTLDFSLIEE